MIVALAALGVAVGTIAGCAADRTNPSAREPSIEPAPSGSSASGEAPQSSVAGLRYVALGDSYTVGTAVPGEGERWPNQLVARLADRQPTLTLTANLGVNGFTSRDLIEVELPQLEGLRPEFASVLIGVNDVVQGVPRETYQANAARILDALLERLPANRIVAVGTPDYTVTPQGASFGDPATQSSAIRAGNAILRDLAMARGIAFVDTFDISLRAAADRTLVADDGLHPSGAQYALWAERIEPVVAELLGR
jgi:acyl-CoA thioesterase-1